MTPLLSVCIPTRNRPECLALLLDVLAPEAAEENVPLIIYDSSTDERTCQVVARKSAAGLQTHYVRNKEKTGIDENMLNVAALAVSTYSLWLGDDDLLVAGAIKAISAELSEHSPDFLLLNAQCVSQDLSVYKDIVNPVVSDQLYNDPRAFFRQHWRCMPYGTLVVNNRLFSEGGGGVWRYVGTSHAYSGVIFDYLAQAFCEKGYVCVRVIKKPLVLLREVEKTWSATAAKILLSEIPQWFDMLPVLYRAEIRPIKEDYLRSQVSPKNIISMRLRGWITWRHYSLFYGKAGLFSWTVFGVVVLVPVSALAYIKRIFYRLKSK